MDTTTTLSNISSSPVIITADNNLAFDAFMRDINPACVLSAIEVTQRYMRKCAHGTYTDGYSVCEYPVETPDQVLAAQEAYADMWHDCDDLDYEDLDHETDQFEDDLAWAIEYQEMCNGPACYAWEAV